MSVELLKRMTSIGAAINSMPAIAVMVKVGEEYGELCEATLAEIGVPGIRDKGLTREDVIKEASDVIGCVMALLTKLDISVEEFVEFSNAKLDHLESIIDQYSK